LSASGRSVEKLATSTRSLVCEELEDRILCACISRPLLIWFLAVLAECLCNWVRSLRKENWERRQLNNFQQIHVD
jgi:hypothetical protein